MVKVEVCSCCGHPLPASGARASLTPMQRRMFDVVLRSGTAGITAPEIMNRLYEDDPDGGAENQNIVPVMAKNIRQRIEKFGITLLGTRGHGSLFYVVPIFRKAEFERRSQNTINRHKRQARAAQYV